MRPIDANTLKAEFTGNFNDGYYTVAEIKAIIDTAPTVGEWVSVKDKLPKDDQDIFVYLNDGQEKRITACNYAKGVWFDCVMNCICVLAHVTHWMPLPEPPKEEKNDA